MSCRCLVLLVVVEDQGADALQVLAQTILNSSGVSWRRPLSVDDEKWPKPPLPLMQVLPRPNRAMSFLKPESLSQLARMVSISAWTPLAKRCP